MSVRSRAVRRRAAAPAHAPAWVRPRHWPAVTAIAGLAAFVAVLPSLPSGGGTDAARPVLAGRPSTAALAPLTTQAGGAGDALPTSQSATVAMDVRHAGGPAVGGGNARVGADALIGASAGGVAGVAQPDVAPSDAATISGLAAGGIPVTALDAYRRAATRENRADPSCRIPWPLLAGIGRVESDHGRYGGAVLLSDGTSTSHIIGIPLDGSRSATITDTDGGRLDGDPVYDRAVGPMQFIPSTWASYGADGNGDGKKDPFNIYDAAAAAAHYLCTAGGDLATLAGQTRAVLAYNHSSDYLALVLNLEHAYAVGVPGLVVPVLPPGPAPSSSAPGSSAPSTPAPGGHAPPPPVDPGPPLSAPSGPTPPHPVVPRPGTSTHPAPPTSAAPTAPHPTTSPTPTTGTPSPTPVPSCPTTSPTGSGSTTPSDTDSGATPSDATPSDTAAETTTPSDSATPSDTATPTDTATSSSGTSVAPACPSPPVDPAP